MQIFIFRSIFFTLWSLDVDPYSVWSLMRIQDPNYNVCWSTCMMHNLKLPIAGEGRGVQGGDAVPPALCKPGYGPAGCTQLYREGGAARYMYVVFPQCHVNYLIMPII